MTDNVIFPPQWVRNAEISLETDTSSAPVPLEGGGGRGPHDPTMDSRVTALETSMTDVKASLRGLETASAEIKGALGTITAVLATLATKADVATTNGDIKALTERVHAQAERLSAVEKGLTDTIAVALSKSLGAGSIVGMVAGIAAITVAVIGAVAWTLHHFQLG